MVVVTEAAINRIALELEGKQAKPIRIFMSKEKGSS